LGRDSFKTQTLSYDSKSRNQRQTHKKIKAEVKERVYWEQTLNVTLFFAGTLAMIMIGLERLSAAQSEP
jgi:hypothetical protein